MSDIADKIKKVGDSLIDLAESLSSDDCEITANELLENIAGRSISYEDATHIDRYLSS